MMNTKAPRLIAVALLLGALLLLAATPTRADEAQQKKDALIVQTISRMETFDYAKASEKVKAAVARFLDAEFGSAAYFALIEKFSIADQKENLVKLAKEKAGKDESRKAVALLLKLGLGDALSSALGDKPEPLLDAIGFVGNDAALAMLTPIITDAKKPVPLRSAAVRALGRTRAGESKLLAMAKDKSLPADLQVTAGNVLRSSTDATIRDEAAKHITLPAGSGGSPLPPIAELVKRSGDAANGKTVYMRACLICHKTGDAGIDFGPALTEIGDKLAKQALYEAILDPSAAISFGFEGFQITKKDGGIAIGYIASDTDAEFTVRSIGGIDVKVPKSDVAKKEKLPYSLMPQGLQAAMSEQELVDLVEYLGSLKKQK